MKRDKTVIGCVVLFALVALACVFGSCADAPQLAAEEALPASPIRYASSPKKIYAKAKNKHKSRTVAYNGLIPNSVLEAAGWPADKLPPQGLQLARRGNGVLPSGVAGKDDPTMQWKTSDTSTPGSAGGLGMGVSSSAAMAGAVHPAAQYCRDMGEGWFLPSFDELRLIYANHSTLGPSYLLRFSYYYYWSSTEGSSDYSWVVSLNDGYTDFNYYAKGSNFRVRCVRYV